MQLIHRASTASIVFTFPGDQSGSSSNGSVITNGTLFIILAGALAPTEVVVLVGTKPLGPLRQGSLPFCSSNLRQAASKAACGCEMKDCPSRTTTPSHDLVT